MTHLDPVMKGPIAATRARLPKGIFPEGVSLLYCPPLTHYDSQGAIDGWRLAAHFRHLSPCVRGFLIPSSTGDGWELTQAERRQGFLLSSANCFARELHQVIADVSAGRLEAARHLSGRLTAAVGQVLRLAAAMPDGNPFTNANKAMDHFFAHGPKAAAVPPPRLHAGSCLPAQLIRSTGEILSLRQLGECRGGF